MSWDEQDVNQDEINAINFHYPNDSSVGFKVDDLMGAITIKNIWSITRKQTGWS